MPKTVYFDASATTPLDPAVGREMLPFFKASFGNAGSLHSKGFEASAALAGARSRVAAVLNCAPEEIVFTGSGTESVNLALKGVAEKHAGKGGCIITTSIEHHAVLDSCKWLASRGFDVTVVGVGREGIVSVDDVVAAIKPSTILVSVMYANNEVGALQPVREVAAACRANGVLFHTDACQAGNSEVLAVRELGVDLMTLNGSKIYGPKGVGCLYVRKGVAVAPQLHGGGQEFGLRSGTENVASLVGFAKALELAQANRIAYVAKLVPLRDELIAGLLKIPGAVLNGGASRRLANNVNVSFPGAEGESIVLRLDAEGICASTGSACSSKSLEPSHVLLALGLSEELAHASVRFSLTKHATRQDVARVVAATARVVSELRAMSPVGSVANG
ncbi:MAG: cysteine desulfurase family protein [Candidatus Micrarchaeota archaeon]